MYKKFGPDEMKEAEEGQSLDAFLKARGYVAIRRTDLGKTLLNIIHGDPENKEEELLSNLMKKKPIDVMFAMAVLSTIEKRLFKNVQEEDDEYSTGENHSEEAERVQ